MDLVLPIVELQFDLVETFYFIFNIRLYIRFCKYNGIMGFWGFGATAKK